jgi:hypothetical protein
MDKPKLDELKRELIAWAQDAVTRLGAARVYVLYLIALPATHLRRRGGFVTSVQVFDLTHVYDAAIPAQSWAT